MIRVESDLSDHWKFQILNRFIDVDWSQIH